MYTKTSTPVVLSELESPAVRFFRDQANNELSPDDYRRHFANIHAFLLDQLRVLAADDFILTEQGEKELTFVLDALLNAKYNVQSTS